MADINNNNNNNSNNNENNNTNINNNNTNINNNNNNNTFEEVKNFENDIINIQTQSGFSKKKSLDRLNQYLELIKNDSNKLSALNNLVFINNNKIYSILYNLLNDNLEKSKTVSLNYLIEVKIPDELINNLIFQLESNIKNEDVEEINYLITKLILSIINNSNGSGSNNILSMNCDKVCKIIKTTLNQNSPDQKEISAKLIQKLSERIPNRIIYFSSELIGSLILNMGNRQQRVRLESMNALTSLALSGSVKIIDTLEPHLLLLANDNSPTIRSTLCKNIEKWATQIPTSIQYYEFLLPILISLSISDITLVRNSAIDSLNSISQFYLNEKSVQIDENTLESFNSLNIQIQDSNKDNQQLILSNLRYYITNTTTSSTTTTTNSDNSGNNETLKELTNDSKKLIFQFSQTIMKRYYRDFHNQELDQNIREFKINFLLAFIGYMGPLPTTRFIDAVIEIITVRFTDHYDQITKKVNEIIYILGLVNIDEKTFVNRIIEKIKIQITAQESDRIDTQLIQICLLTLKKYYSSLLINNKNLNIGPDSSFSLLIEQFKLIIFKLNNLFINEFISFLNQMFTVNNLLIVNGDETSIYNLCKILILLDIYNQNGGSNNMDLFNLISSKCGFTNYLELLEKNCEHLIKEISNKDKNQLQKQQSHLLILNYILNKLPITITNKYNDQINKINNNK